jgi:hypothetical protein
MAETMIVAGEMKSEIVNKLVSLAQTKGVTVEELLYACVPGLTGNATTQMRQSNKIQSFIDWAKKLPTEKPLLSDEAVHRRSIYED